MRTAFFRIYGPGMIGNIMEVYDMTLYGLLAPYLALSFFPKDNYRVAIIQTFLVFFVGFLARPIAAIFFGHIGDVYGRKIALMLSVILIGAATALMGFLPTYHSMGIYAVLMLVVLRLFQGLSVGGEYFGSSIFLLEHAPQQRRGFFGGLIQNSALMGTLIASFVCWLLVLICSHQTIVAFAWRIPFYLALIGGLAGLWLRARSPETDAFKSLKKERKITRKPFLTALKSHKAAMCWIIGFTWLGMVSSYLLIVYITTYLHVMLHYSMRDSMTVMLVSVITLLIWFPVGGMLSDKFGRKKVLFCSVLGVIILAMPYYVLLGTHVFLVALASQLILMIPFAIYNSVAITVFVELVPSQVRFSAGTIAYNLGALLFGGSTPLVASYLIHRTHDICAPAYYLIIVGVITLGMVARVSETSTRSLVV